LSTKLKLCYYKSRK